LLPLLYRRTRLDNAAPNPRRIMKRTRRPTAVLPAVLALRRELAPAVGGDPPAVRFSPGAFGRDPDAARDQIDGLWARLDLHGVAGAVAGAVAGGVTGASPTDEPEADRDRPPEILLRADADLGLAAEVVGEWVSGTDLTVDSPDSN
jgi:hypothetical protein